MFEWLRSSPAPEGPVEFSSEVEISASAEDVYRLIDFSDQANARRALGDHVTDIANGEKFELRLVNLSKFKFYFTVTEAKPFSRYAYKCEIEPHPGNLVSSHEEYVIEPVRARTCLLRQTTQAQFREGLRMRTFNKELSRMNRAMSDSQNKLKVHAEKGVNAALLLEKF